jgi:predicted phage terminase large subunit-like protein
MPVLHDRDLWRVAPAQFARALSGGRWKYARHLELISDKLAEAAYAGGKRIIIATPPRHGKSELASGYTPSWYLELFPDRDVLLCMHTGDSAKHWGRRNRNLIAEHEQRLNLRLANDAKAAGRWRTQAGGGMRTAGIGGAITGHGAHLAIIDDYCKSAEEAHSEAWRRMIWDWWASDFYTRLEPGASVVIVATRWHEDDLAGRLLAEYPDEWELIELPAIADGPDMLGRKAGEALWPERWPVDALERIRETQAEWVWSALYQQQPSPGEGSIWRREWLREFHWQDGMAGEAIVSPHGRFPYMSCRRFGAADLAIKENDRACYTALGVWAQHGKWLHLVDVYHARVEGPEILEAMHRMNEKWQVGTWYLEEAQAQAYMVQFGRRPGYVVDGKPRGGLSVQGIRPDREKYVRWQAAAPRFSAGEVFFARGAPWRAALDRELLSVPASKHNDLADMVALAELVSRQYQGTPGAMPPAPAPRLADPTAGFRLPKPAKL